MFGALLCGGISGILSSIITFPADVVRRRLQVVGLTTQMDATQVIKVNAYSEFMKIIQIEGFKGMYRGIVPELLMNKFSVAFALGGTSFLIVVNVVLDTFTQIQTHLFSSRYEGLVKKMRLKEK